MLSQLKANFGKRVGLELLNGSKIFGTIVETNEKSFRIDTEEAIVRLMVDSVQILWDDQENSRVKHQNI
ncbi:hypothetical protein AXX12_10215 [Anaerosporomusa subterranea]|uniref:DUF2642 domain-containing protein n=1 Tax=Anaerosporomusa subterranea TaxID=1794912 RepID=A0A154BSD1_ANASB|nr:hypothetical protein [Anaerosporomusa subterranea]KYZ76775.1 hypothetical protein AXX12_10215 [Anaerosporomusa subterranea]